MFFFCHLSIIYRYYEIVRSILPYKLKAQSRCNFHITSLVRFPLFPSYLPRVLQRVPSSTINVYHLKMLSSLFSQMRTIGSL
ncbi:hypothetical protein Hanom_Chr08g00723181 [Helianthus anomalus]